MTKDFLELIQKTAQQAQAVAVVKEIPTDGRSLHVRIGDKLAPVVIPPAVRAHQVHTLEDLVSYAQKASRDFADSTDEPVGPPVVWHGHGGVVLVVDDADRRDLVTFPLSLSDRFSTLIRLAKERPSFDQRKFVRLLRFDLGLDAVVANKFRKLDWVTGSEASRDVGHGKDRLGQQIRAECSGVDEIPEEIVVSVPVYQQSGERQEFQVRCGVEPDATNQLLQLIPLPDEIERALDNAQAAIRERLENGLADAGVAIYYGEP